MIPLVKMADGFLVKWDIQLAWTKTNDTHSQNDQWFYS